MNYIQAVEHIEKLNKFGGLTGVERGRYILERLGNPEKNMKVVHVAGTNGKGSVCSYLSHIMLSSGKRTGMFISPHLIRMNERIRIDNESVSDEVFMEAFAVVADVEKSLHDENICDLTYFDFLFGMAMYIFANEGVEYVILETGLGGRLDTTNCISTPLLCVITSISLDHTDILGETYEAIAGEKAGIIKKGVPVIFLDNNENVTGVIRSIAKEKESDPIAVCMEDSKILKNDGKHIDFLVNNEYYKSSVFRITTVALYQVMNCMLAVTAAHMIGIPYEKVRDGVLKNFWEGRMEEAADRIYIDGAHNPDGIRQLMESVRLIKNKRRCVLLFSVVRDKHYDEMIRIICENRIFDEIIITQLEGTRRLENDEIMRHFAKYTSVPVKVFEKPMDAFYYGKDTMEEGILVCAGSLYLIGELRSIIRGR